MPDVVKLRTDFNTIVLAALKELGVEATLGFNVDDEYHVVIKTPKFTLRTWVQCSSKNGQCNAQMWADTSVMGFQADFKPRLFWKFPWDLKQRVREHIARYYMT